MQDDIQVTSCNDVELGERLVETTQKEFDTTQNTTQEIDGLVETPRELVEGLVEKAEELAVKLTDNRRKMLATIIQSPSVSKEELAHIIGISTTAIDKNIDVMRGKLIRRVGPDKGGHWEVLK